MAATAVIVLGVLGGSRRRSTTRRRRVSRPRWSVIAAVVLAVLWLMLVLAMLLLTGLTSFVVVPVVNYGLPLLVLVAAGALGVGRVLGRWRARQAARYPPPLH